MNAPIHELENYKKQLQEQIDKIKESKEKEWYTNFDKNETIKSLEGSIKLVDLLISRIVVK